MRRKLLFNIILSFISFFCVIYFFIKYILNFLHINIVTSGMQFNKINKILKVLYPLTSTNTKFTWLLLKNKTLFFLIFLKLHLLVLSSFQYLLFELYYILYLIPNLN